MEKELIEKTVKEFRLNLQDAPANFAIDDATSWLRTTLSSLYESGYEAGIKNSDIDKAAGYQAGIQAERTRVREEVIKVVKNSRTVEERRGLGVGKTQDIARTQAIVDILALLSTVNNREYEKN